MMFNAEKEEEMVFKHFVALQSHLLMNNVIALDIPETMQTFFRLFQRTGQMWTDLPDYIQPKWFPFLRDLLPALETLSKGVENEYEKDKAKLKKDHPDKAALIAMLDEPDFLLTSTWSPEDRKFFKRWRRNLLRRIARRFDNFTSTVQSSVGIFNLERHLHDRMLLNRMAIRYCKEITLCRMCLPPTSRDHFFDLLGKSLKFFDHRIHLSQREMRRGDA
jgi:hypothetical protein